MVQKVDTNIGLTEKRNQDPYSRITNICGSMYLYNVVSSLKCAY